MPDIGDMREGIKNRFSVTETPVKRKSKGREYMIHDRLGPSRKTNSISESVIKIAHEYDEGHVTKDQLTHLRIELKKKGVPISIFAENALTNRDIPKP